MGVKTMTLLVADLNRADWWVTSECELVGGVRRSDCRLVCANQQTASVFAEVCFGSDRDAKRRACSKR